MATVPSFRNVLTIIGEDGIERVTDFQLIESSFVIVPPVETPPETPSSVCPSCGDLNINISDGHMICHECGTEATFGMTVEATSMSDLLELIENNDSNPCGEIRNELVPIKKYDDIVGNIRNRFDILDL